MSDDRAEFSVVEFLDDGTHRFVERYMYAGTAVLCAKLLVDHHPDNDVALIIITDGGDHTVFMWERGKGVTYPTPEMRAEHERGS